MIKIGIFSLGDMGFEVARRLKTEGFSVLTTLDERSERTQSLAKKAGLVVDLTFVDVVTQVDMIISLVSPDKAIELSRRVARVSNGNSPLYIDANSVSPLTATQVESVLVEYGIHMVDAGFHGSSTSLGSNGVLFLSGQRADEVADVFRKIVSVKIVGASVGDASSIKMLLAGLNKGIAALFIELSAAAQNADLLPETLETYDSLYPGIMEVVRRILPSYPIHATRRVAELSELEKTILSWGSSSTVIPGARAIVRAIANGNVQGNSIEELIIGWSKILQISPAPPEE